jgi:hypothetical protein
MPRTAIVPGMLDAAEVKLCLPGDSTFLTEGGQNRREQSRLVHLRDHVIVLRVFEPVKPRSRSWPIVVMCAERGIGPATMSAMPIIRQDGCLTPICSVFMQSWMDPPCASGSVPVACGPVQSRKRVEGRGHPFLTSLKLLIHCFPPD